MFIWYSSSQCGTSLSSYQCIFVKSHHRIELASNPEASCSLWSVLAIFLSSSSKIFSCLWSFLLLSCQLTTLGHPAFSEAERALWHSPLEWIPIDRSSCWMYYSTALWCIFKACSLMKPLSLEMELKNTARNKIYIKDKSRWQILLSLN